MIKEKIRDTAMNYQLELDKLINELQKKQTDAAYHVPRLLLHSCCAPCSSYVLEYLSQYFAITLLYYNPNIFPEEEYRKRVEEQQRLIGALPVKHPISFVEGRYRPEEFFEIAKGLEKVPEGGERCRKCFRLRLEEAAKIAAEGKFDYYTTTLSISPLKDAQALNEIGQELAAVYEVPYLPSDFKKRGGYQRSIELSREYELYRQNFCGCVYSMRESTKREEHLPL